ncbi:iron ABC transporter permease [Macrococcoides bohemicum]|uniref:Probable heme-iron transport system permease protein IsdF n=1 Tax=Macrococcoides bohemicum TaxID=1903056 RepID=A0A4V3B1A5_9STAP|nr:MULTISPECIES: iron ABC transporter permease [Macrococcus]MBC9874376.1 iron ABC transporter permease [Macrococcus bohemicus]QRN48870.1 iron ABC transporter permease [Macrococcus bohemicus]QYA42625.1 iron ABC transporter permease [Macrococcus bohemicus]QYA45007.1 iron ABC transporter permease [Macrococcus bohemicus]TDL36178.1 iron ABC transporter permease [Macrococcus bohemicus]
MHTKTKNVFISTILIIILFAIITVSMTVGDFKMPPLQFLKTLFGMGNETDTMVLYEFRMPRLLVTILCGAALSLSGALLQSITKNPLADPGIIGINAGSGFFIALLMIFMPVDSSNFVYVLPLFSLIGGLITAATVFLLSSSKRGLNPMQMILIGVGLSTALSGAMIMMTSTFNKEDVEFISKWLGGNIWGDTWPFVWMIITVLIITIPILLLKLDILNILNTHEHISTGLGIRINRERVVILIISVMLCASAVSICGSIAFVGLIAPHIARQLVGPRHQVFIPITILLGAILLSFADTLGRLLIEPAGMPAGIIVSIIGAPYFLYLMRRGL